MPLSSFARRFSPLSARWLSAALLTVVLGCGDSGGGTKTDGAVDKSKDAASDKGTGGAPLDASGNKGGNDGGAGTGGLGGTGVAGGNGGAGTGGAGQGGSAGSGGTAGASTGGGGAGGAKGGAGGATGGAGQGGQGGKAGQGGQAGQGGKAGQGGSTNVPTCQDQIKNADETDVDCGGHCGPCKPGQHCLVGNDCSLASCTAAKTCAECAAPADCPGTDSECSHRTCTAGACGRANETVGKVLTAQTGGDCKVRKCAAGGTVLESADETDKPDDTNSCTADSCNGMTQVFAPLAASTACGATGSNMVCDGNARCVGCVTASTCPGTDNACRTRTCVNHTCGVTLKPAGTKLADPLAGDCRGQACDDKGDLQNVPTDTDLPNDGNPCTTDTCSSGTQSHTPIDVGTTCATGKVCDGANHCVECLNAGTCPGADTECRTRTCMNGICGTSFAMVNKPLASQSSGDCKTAVCDGQGSTTTLIETTDAPPSGLCTVGMCSGSMPTTTPKTMGTTCGPNQVCNNAGSCVGCNADSDCGTNTACTTFTCVNNACNVAQSPGKLITTLPLGDCKASVCNATGQIVDGPADTDNDDGNECTTDSCVGGQPQHQPVAARTTCTQNGGTMCNGSSNAACVACVADTDCVGTINACQHPSCNNGMCGTALANAGTILPTNLQTPNDCHTKVCDNAGNEVNGIDDTDLPATDGNQCTTEVCAGGTPGHTPTPKSPCGQNGGTVCDNESVPQCSPEIWVVRVGDGTTVLSNVAFAAFLERIAVLDNSDAGPAMSVTDLSTGAKPFTLSGTGDSEGALALSKDGHFVTLAGYSSAAGAGTPAVKDFTGTVAPRVAAFVGPTGIVDTSTSMGTVAFNKDNVRSAVSSDGTNVWVAGNGSGSGATANSGVYQTTKGSSVSATKINVQNTRVCQIWLNQLICSVSAGSKNELDLYGTPGVFPTAALTPNVVQIAPSPAPPALNPYGFAVIDLNGNGLGLDDVLYISSDTSGILRFKVTAFDPVGAAGSSTMTVTYDGAITTTPTGFPTPMAFAFRSLTAQQDTTGAVVLVVTMPGYVIRYVDDPKGLTTAATGAVLRAAPTNTTYRGVAIAPRP